MGSVVEDLVSARKDGTLNDRLVIYLLAVFEKDRLLIEPIGQLTPYRRTSIWLFVSLIISIASGFFHRMLSGTTIGLVIGGEDITLSHIVGLFLLAIWWYVGQKLYVEFRYMKRLTVRLEQVRN